MYERLLSKNDVPTAEVFIEHMGDRKGLFEDIDTFLADDMKSEGSIKFDAHSRCWKMSYHANRLYICDIVTEKNSFTVVTRLAEESIKIVYGDAIPYIRECIDTSPFRHRGWIRFRILDASHLENMKSILRVRAGRK